MKLKSILKQQSEDQLEEILDFWGFQKPVFPAKSSKKARLEKYVEHLYPRLQLTQYYQKAWAKLEEDEKQLVNFLTVHGGDLPRDEVLERQFEDDEETYGELLERTSAKGFVFEDDLSDEDIGEILVGVPEPYLRFISLPSYWEGYLGYYLRDLTTNELKTIANTHLGIDLESQKKNYLIARIREHLLDPDELRAYIKGLAEPIRGVFEQIVARKGVCIYRELLEAQAPRRFDHAKSEAVNKLIDGSGLVFVAQEGDTKHNHMLMIPRDIQYIITNNYEPDARSLDHLDTVSIIEHGEQPNVILDNSNNILRDLTIFAGYINSHMVRTLANGGIGKNDLKKILPLLSAGKTLKYCDFLSLFLIHNKYIISVGDVWRVSNTFPRWIEDSKKCYSELFAYYLDTNEWNEEYVDGDTVHADVFPANLVNIAEVRKIVFANLVSTPRNRWLKFPNYSEALLPEVEMAIPKRSSSATLDKFNRTLPQILESIIGECLYWMGMITLGLNDDKQLEIIGTRDSDAQSKGRRSSKIKKAQDFAFRPTELGRAVLQSDLKNTEKLFDGQEIDHIMLLNYRVEHFTVLPSNEIITPPDLKLRAFYHLNEFSEMKTLDVMATLALTRESVRRGMDAGLRAEDILKFLTKGSAQPLPETVKHLIHECSSKHGEVRLGMAGGYLVIDDPMLFEEIRNQKRLAKDIKDIVGDKVILLNSDVDTKKLGKLLYKMGYMPNIDSENIHVTQEGQFHLTFNNEELYGLMAVMRYVLELEEELGQTIAADDARSLLERLRPDANTYYELNFFADNISKRYSRKFETTLKKRLDDATKKYKTQVSKLIEKTPRQTSKYAFDGPNPAENIDDIMNMIDFALDNDLQLEIVYLKTNQEEAEERIEPESLSGGKLYAYNPVRDRTSVYRLDRIKQSSLS